MRDHLPLQQGLRHIAVIVYDYCCHSTRPSSTTIRIKTKPRLGMLYDIGVLDHRPLQQGLRHSHQWLLQSAS